MRPSHAILFVAGIIGANSHAAQSAELFWAAFAIALIGIWAAWWEGAA